MGKRRRKSAARSKTRSARRSTSSSSSSRPTLEPGELLSLRSLLPFATDAERAELAELLGDPTLADPPASSSSTPSELLQEKPPETIDVEVVAKTRAEAARLLNVDERTISRWATEDGFPGKAGTAGKQDGHFPIGKIRAWKAERDQETAGGDRQQQLAGIEWRLRALAADAARREVDLERQRGNLIELDEAVAIVSSRISAARSLFEEIPDDIANALPANRPKLRRRVARIARQKVAQALAQLADVRLGGRGDDDDDETGRAVGVASAGGGDH